MIKLIETVTVSRRIEKQYKIDVDGHEIWVSKYESFNEFDNDYDFEIFKGKEFLTEDDEENLIDFLETLED
jgi:hypothetical protein